MYATTASDATHSSYGTYCSPDDKVDGKSINSCLGDLYSVNWMEDADKAISAETLGAQFTTVKQLTTKSTVEQFGDVSIASELVTAFEGNGKDVAAPAAATGTCASMCKMLPSSVHCKMASCKACGSCSAVESSTAAPTAAKAMSLPSADATLSSAFSRFLAGDDAAADELVKSVRMRQAAKRRFETVANKVAGRSAASLPQLTGSLDVECHYKAHKAYIRSCGEWDPEALAYSSTLAQLCATTNGDAARITAAVAEVCAK